ncbi:MAG: copper amine oxidase N-terminal domain-containing protein [Firmicutes bacterium]|nr:copper amine oxidase N-terminal domain-containing protein [Bacillota bacterium]
MKKIMFSLIFALGMSIPLTVFGGAPQWRVDKIVTVEEGTELTIEDAPEVVIKKHKNFRNDFDFEIELTNAEWLYDEDGSIAEGINYITFGESTLIVMVDTDTFDASEKDIRIPLYCRVNGVAKVGVKCTDYVIEGDPEMKFGDLPYDDTTAIKYNGDSKLTGENDELGAVIIEEWKTSDIKAGKGYKFILSNEFVFTETGKVTLEGDFAEKTEYEYSFDEKRPDRVTLIFKNDLERPTGTIMIKGLKVSSTAKSLFKGTDLVVTKDGDDDYVKAIDLGDLIQSVPSDAPLKVVSVKMDKGKIEIEGTGAPSKKVRVYVGGSLMGETRVDTKGEWELEKEFKKELVEGTYLVETGYYSNSTGRFTSVVKTDVDIHKENNENVYFTVGVDKYKIGAKEFDIDGGLYIDSNDRMMVPLRALANAIGVEDDDIKWNDAAKSIILEKDDRKIEVYIGSDKLLINGLEVKMNTEAVIKNSRTYLPLRSICEAFGRENIVWDGTTKTVMIGK